jgi:hypothetical protein
VVLTVEDVVLIATMIAFFLAAGGLVKVLDKLIASGRSDNSKNGDPE